jgi:hypothetical protein
VPHANAALTPKARLELGPLIVDVGWSVSTAADYYLVSRPAVKRWAERYREQRELTDGRCIAASCRIVRAGH